MLGGTGCSRGVAASYAVVFLWGGAGCHALLRHPTAVFPFEDRQVVETLVASGMNLDLLSATTTSEVVLEVDWIAGEKPAPRTIAALRETLERHGPPGHPVRVVLDSEIPRAQWLACCTEDTTPLVNRYLSTWPDRERGREVVYALFAPYQQRSDFPLLGYASAWVAERAGGFAVVPGFTVYGEPVRQAATLWITRAKVQESAAVHELGHVLGLVSNPEHEQRDGPRHCAATNCVMTPPTLRVIAANFVGGLFLGRIPSRYCDECRRDIEMAQRVWKRRLRTESPTALVERRRAGDLVRIGSHLTETGRLAQAVEVLRRAAVASRHAEAEVPLLRALLAGGDTDGALTLLGEFAGERFATPGGDRSLFLVQAAELLCDAGRYADALALLPPKGEGSSYPGQGFFVRSVRARALEGLGRPADALAVLETPLVGQAGASAHWGLGLAALQRRLGRFADAERSVAMGLNGGLRSADWKLEAARLARARGVEVQARSRLLEIVDDTEPDGGGFWARRFARAGSEWLRLRTRATALALLHDARARVALVEAEAAERRLTLSRGSAALRIRVLALLGDFDGALAALASLRVIGDGEIDLCLDEDLAVLRRDPRFARKVPRCSGGRQAATPMPGRSVAGSGGLEADGLARSR